MHTFNPTSWITTLIMAFGLLFTDSAVVAQTAPAAPAVATTAEPSAEELLNALNSVFGRHPGARGSHPKGFCAKGEFVPSVSARSLTSAPLYLESKIPATVRFSVGGGNRRVSDKARVVRGLAIRLNGTKERHELVLISEPIFFAATTRSFIEFFKARVPDPATGKPDPAKVTAYAAAFPDGALQPALVASHPATASYATTVYHSPHAFAFKSGQRTTFARVVAAPVAGLSFLAAEEETSKPDTFLEAEARASQRCAHRVYDPYSARSAARLADRSDAALGHSGPSACSAWTAKSSLVGRSGYL